MAQDAQQPENESGNASDKAQAPDSLGATLDKAGSDLKSSATEAGQTLKSEVASLADDLKATATAAASQVLHAAQDEVKARGVQAEEQARETVASKVHNVADSVREREKLPQAKVIDKFADRIDEGASYVQSHDSGEMKAELARQVREAPLLSVGLALMAGFLLGALLKRG